MEGKPKASPLGYSRSGSMADQHDLGKVMMKLAATKEGTLERRTTMTRAKDCFQNEYKQQCKSSSPLTKPSQVLVEAMVSLLQCCEEEHRVLETSLIEKLSEIKFRDLDFHVELPADVMDKMLQACVDETRTQGERKRLIKCVGFITTGMPTAEAYLQDNAKAQAIVQKIETSHGSAVLSAGSRGRTSTLSSATSRVWKSVDNWTNWIVAKKQLREAPERKQVQDYIKEREQLPQKGIQQASSVNRDKEVEQAIVNNFDNVKATLDLVQMSQNYEERAILIEQVLDTCCDTVRCLDLGAETTKDIDTSITDIAKVFLSLDIESSLDANSPQVVVSNADSVGDEKARTLDSTNDTARTPTEVQDKDAKEIIDRPVIVLDAAVMNDEEQNRWNLATTICGSILSKKQADVIFLLDKSGSMSGEKIERMRITCHALRLALKDRDKVIIRAFSDDVDEIKDVDGILAIEACSGTAMLQPLVDALNEPILAGRKGYVVLMTDGQPNEPKETIRSIVETQNSARQLITVGFGSRSDFDAEPDYDVDFLRNIASPDPSSVDGSKLCFDAALGEDKGPIKEIMAALNWAQYTVFDDLLMSVVDSKDQQVLLSEASGDSLPSANFRIGKVIGGIMNANAVVLHGGSPPFRIILESASSGFRREVRVNPTSNKQSTGAWNRFRQFVLDHQSEIRRVFRLGFRFELKSQSTEA